MTHTLYTWGYQSRSIEELLVIVRAHPVICVADVRRTPYSRHQPEFCEHELRRVFGGYYRHAWILGNQHRTLPWKRGPEWERDVKGAAAQLGDCPVLLLCLERDPERCHRSEVAHEIRGLCGCEVTHLGGPEPTQPVKQMSLF